MQETSHRPTHRWNVMSKQRKSNWQHPNSYYRERQEAEHSPTDECDTSRHPHPYRTLRTKALQIMADPGRDVILEAVHFLVKIGNPRHPRVSGILISSDVVHAAVAGIVETTGTLTQRHSALLIGMTAGRVESRSGHFDTRLALAGLASALWLPQQLRQLGDVRRE